eukprot:gene18767-24534_t
MTLENFKSYAGIQEIGPFHKRFSSIVGPNGSGKSNVIDALLFVFGKRAKQLRLNKVSELIHKSSNFPNLEYARVSVYFQLINDNEESDDDFEVIPGSEFTITRIAYQNNQSKYTIDSKTSTYTEVGVLLRSHGIDLDNNRFLILQGEVEQIAMMKPKGATPHEEGLLEYLEDIIGSNEYVEKIEEISKSLDVINEQRVERVNRLKLAERERDNLSGSKTEAELFLNKENEIRKSKNILYQTFEKIAFDNIQDLTNRFDKLNEKYVYEQSKLKDQEQELNQKQKLYQQFNEEYVNVEKELSKATSDFAAFERRDVKLNEDIKHNSSLLRKTQASIVKDTKKETESLADAEKAASQLETLTSQLKELESKKLIEETKIDEIMSGLQEATKSHRERLEATQISLADSERGISGLITEKEALATKLSIIKSRVESVNSNITNTSTKITSLQDEMTRLTTLIADIKSKNVKSEKTNESNGSNAVIQALMKQCKPGGQLAAIAVHGRLGDLASIDPKYDVAISTACSSLDHIVVDTSNDAQACLEYLRANNIGRASFIPLDRMNEWISKIKPNYQPPNETERLFDLIQLNDNKYKGAFYMSLRDTLVAKDLNTAVRIAYVGDKAVHRVVTLTGQLIDTSGAMSGGGNNQRSGCMKLSNGTKSTVVSNKSVDKEISQQVIAKLEQLVLKAEEQLSVCRHEKENISNQLRELKASVKDAIIDLEKKEMVLHSITSQISDLTDTLTTLSKETKYSPSELNEMKSLENQIESIDNQMNQVSPNIQGLRQAVSNIQRQILDVGGPTLARAQATVDLINTQIDKLRSNIATIDVEISNHKKQAIKSSNNRIKLEQELNKVQNKLSALSQEQLDMENDAIKVNEAVEQATNELKIKEQTMLDMQKSYKVIQDQVYDNLRRERLDKFMNGFGIISLRLKEMYQMITLGGDAELELVDSLDPFSEGVVFSVRPPKKSWKNITNLSGGEKTLSSLALVFALHHYKPTPLYVMDEIDAALDFKNVSIVANYIKERTKNAQFIIISLRNNMFELADRLVGIYKTFDTTKSVTINPKMFESMTVDESGTSNNETNSTTVDLKSSRVTVKKSNRKVLGDSTNINI